MLKAAHLFVAAVGLFLGISCAADSIPDPYAGWLPSCSELALKDKSEEVRGSDGERVTFAAKRSCGDASHRLSMSVTQYASEPIARSEFQRIADQAFPEQPESSVLLADDSRWEEHSASQDWSGDVKFTITQHVLAVDGSLLVWFILHSTDLSESALLGGATTVETAASLALERWRPAE